MAKYDLKIKARQMRSEGQSVKDIAKILEVSKGTASIWVRDIILTVEQLEKLRGNSLKGAERGRLISALLQKQKRIKLQEIKIEEGIKILGQLSYREFLIAGLSLYWAEGCKKTRKVEFCNSDPKLVNFMINWLKQCIGISFDRLIAIVGINAIHQFRDQKVKNYWSNTTNIPLNQFRKTSFKYVTNKKVYENFEDHYGTLSIRVSKPSEFYYKILGLIDALSKMPA